MLSTPEDFKVTVTGNSETLSRVAVTVAYLRYPSVIGSGDTDKLTAVESLSVMTIDTS